MPRLTHIGFVVAVLYGGIVVPGRGQNTTIDRRWLAYVGCWEPIGGLPSLLCVVPAADTSAADLVTIVNGAIVGREHMAATGERRETIDGDCTGWQSAAWSGLGARIYLKSEDACSGNPRSGTGLVAMTRDGLFLYIQAMTLGGKTGLRIQRYQEAANPVELPDEVRGAVQGGIFAKIQARAAAGAPLAIEDVVEASQYLDSEVIEAWLVERREPFALDAKGLIALADAGVSSDVIDLMVALTYPRLFAINPSSGQAERRTEPAVAYGVGGFDMLYPYVPYDYLGLEGYAYGFGYSYPLTIIYTPGGSPGSGAGSSRSHGRVVNGRGYEEGAGASADASVRPAQPRPEPSARPATSSSSPSAGSSSRPTSTSSSGEQRTAKPRP